MAQPDLAYQLIGWFSTTRFDRLLHPFLYRLTTDGGWIVGRLEPASPPGAEL